MATIVPGTFSGNLSSTIGAFSAGDTIVIPPSSAVAYTSGLDLSANELEAFIISSGVTSTFGSASAGGVLLNLSAGTYTGKFVHAGSASAYIDPASAIARTQKIGPGDLYGLGGTWTTVEHAVGLSSFNDTAAITTLYVTGGSAFVDTHASSTITTASVQAGASLVCRRSAATVNVNGGTYTQPERTPTITTLTVTGNGRAYHAGGTITTVNGYAGVLDLSGVSADVTITTLNKYSNAFSIVLPKPPFVLTITNENYFGDASRLGV